MGAGGRIYFSCPDVAEARGGVRIIYRHVDHLNAAGMEAWVMHEKEGFHASWFEHATRVTDRGKVMREAIKGDIVVLPEIVRPEGADVMAGVKKVIFNQNAYYTFVNEPNDQEDGGTLYTHPDVVCAAVESEARGRYLAWAFPKLTVHRVKVG